MRRGLFLSVCLCLALSVFAGDQSIEIALGLNGKLHLPDQLDKPDRAVLMLHGWNGHMDEVGNLYLDLARELGALGIASVRFNFSGEGEREGFVVTSTLGSRIRESELAYEFLKAKLPQAQIGVQGFSLGGLTAMVIAAEHPEWFQTMVLWSAAQTMRMDRDEAYNEAVQRAMREGQSLYKDWADITLTRKFLSSFIGVNASLSLSRYPGAFLSIRGDRDFLVSHDRRWLDLVPTTDKSFVLIGGADHIFNVLVQPKTHHGSRVLKTTSDWFDRTLDSAAGPESP